jgi:ParB/RepB/Spo0J family partition protein
MIALARLDEPSNPMRDEMNEDELVQLAQSILAVGLLQPLVVRPRGDRFEIIAGHRRYRALKIANLFEAPCNVVVVDDAVVEAMKMAENVDRADVNPADEAGYLAIVLEKLCENDFDRLVALTKKSESYLNNRLALFQGEREVFAALQRNEINLAVATELNRFKDPIARISHLRLALAQGTSARAVKEWRINHERMLEVNAAAIAAGDAAHAAIASAPQQGPLCPVCRQDKNPGDLAFIWIHRYCNQAVLEELLRAYHGDTNA